MLTLSLFDFLLFDGAGDIMGDVFFYYQRASKRVTVYNLCS